MTKKKEQDLNKFDGREDALDPRFIFNSTANQLLTEALNEEFRHQLPCEKRIG